MQRCTFIIKERVSWLFGKRFNWTLALHFREEGEAGRLERFSQQARSSGPGGLQRRWRQTHLQVLPAYHDPPRTRAPGTRHGVPLSGDLTTDGPWVWPIIINRRVEG
ncbi:hypothetical protein AAFF_G00241450 [Aldrovandia affinis]|uniref:Uncharacterized protein n=1 Tax=Aldrovandia affinis TaxID=143900 RepID=A0AAD7WUV3_9TELE|nr:hypothetical protein AAFF_G00241450 [Aldrovandia affinis]